MGDITSLIAASGCMLVLCIRAVYGLTVRSILSMWCPYSMGTVSVGTIDFSVGRTNRK